MPKVHFVGGMNKSLNQEALFSLDADARITHTFSQWMRIKMAS